MFKAAWVLALALAVGVGVAIGISLGAWLGRIGAFELLRMISRTPLLILKSPAQFKPRWRQWKEWHERRKVDRIRLHNQITEFKEKIAASQNEIKRTKAEIRRARWQFLEPR